MNCYLETEMGIIEFGGNLKSYFKIGSVRVILILILFLIILFGPCTK